MIFRRRERPEIVDPNDSGGAVEPLVFCAVVLMVLHASLWIRGIRDYELALATERGAAEVERRMKGESEDEEIRDAIRLQRESLPFWTTVSLLTDFLITPTIPAVRTLVVAVVFSAWAAVVGRPARFGRAMVETARWQAIWVFGEAVRTVLALMLGHTRIETSLVLLLPAGTYPVANWYGLRELDAFSILGWLVLGWAAWRREQANWVMALVVVLGLGALEAMVNSGAALTIDLSIRRAIVPE